MENEICLKCEYCNKEKKCVKELTPNEENKCPEFLIKEKFVNFQKE